MSYKVTCENCDFEKQAPDFSNADLIRDNHELEMFNWRGDKEACGPCNIKEVSTQ